MTETAKERIYSEFIETIATDKKGLGVIPLSELRDIAQITLDKANKLPDSIVNDNLKEHLWPYSDEDIAIIREEKTQLVTAAEFTQVHKEKLEAERKIATAVKALESIKERTERDELDEYYRERNHDVRNDAVKALAEIGVKDE